MRLRSLLLLLSVTVAAPAARAQDTTSRRADSTRVTHVLKTRDGSTLFGRVASDTGATIVFETAGGTLTIPRSNVADLRAVDRKSMRNGQYWFADPNRTRLFFAPTGRMLNTGEGYYSNTYLFLQQFAAGATDHVTIGGGFSLFPTGDMAKQVYYFTPEVGLYNTERNNVALGGIMAWVPTDDGKPFGVVYAVGSHGGAEGSVTGGLGYGFYGSDFSSRPVGMLGGTRRVSSRVALLTENYGIIYDDANVVCQSGPPATCSSTTRHRLGVLSLYGVRFLGEKMSIDLALANVKSSDTDWIFPGVPYVAFAVKF